MNELELVLVGDSYAAPPAHILEGLDDSLVHNKPAGAPHSIYEELWHLAFWQQLSLDWFGGIETPVPTSAADGFPNVLDMEREYWPKLVERFLLGARQAAALAADESGRDKSIRCPTLPGRPVRTMSIRDQLESLGAHNAYHLGRIVLLRQLLGVWPPKSGGYTW